jgi:hypothetical protein
MPAAVEVEPLADSSSGAASNDHVVSELAQSRANRIVRRVGHNSDKTKDCIRFFQSVSDGPIETVRRTENSDFFLKNAEQSLICIDFHSVQVNVATGSVL